MIDEYVFLIKHPYGGVRWEKAKSPTQLQRKYPKSDISLYNIWHTVSSKTTLAIQDNMKLYIDFRERYENLEQTT